MKKAITKFGLILGFLLVLNMIWGVSWLYNNPTMESQDVLGYTILVVIFSLIFFGIRNYRNEQLTGKISFGQAFKIGALIALIGSTMYVVVWLFYYHLFVPDFLDKYIEHVLSEAQRTGATATEITSTTEEMVDFKEMYKNPLFIILITYFEVLPIGLVVALISSLILKKQ